MSKNQPLRILIYKGMWSHSPKCAPCGCEFIYDRSRWQDADAVVFHIPELTKSGFPPRKLNNQYWVAWSMESETNYPFLSRRSELSAVFDLWMTYQQDSDVWCPYIYADMVDGLKRAPLEKTASSLAVSVISSHFDQSRRAALVTALKREMPVDSYGTIRRNLLRRLLDRCSPMNKIANRSLKDTKIGSGPSAKHTLIARYKFTLAFENSICTDYVTEKFFDPLLVGSVPVYLGAPNVEEYAPGENCYIDATRFESPRALARFLVELAANDEAYARYLHWKSQPLSPRFIAAIEKVRREPFHRLADLLRQLPLSNKPTYLQ